MYYFPKNIIEDIINYSSNLETELYLYFLNLKNYDDKIYLLDIKNILYNNINLINNNKINNKKLIILLYLKKILKNNYNNYNLFIIVIFQNINITINNEIIIITINEILNILYELKKVYLILYIDNLDEISKFNNILKVYINNYNNNIFNKISIKSNSLLSNKITIYKSDLHFTKTILI